MISTDLFDRTLSNLRQVVRDIWRRDSNGEPRPGLPPEDVDRLAVRMRECLEARGGEVSARARAAALGHTYLGLDAAGRKRFLRLLASQFDIDHAAVLAAADALKATQDDGKRLAAEAKLRAALEAPRVKLLTQFTALPQGVKFLVDLRAELMGWMKDDPQLRSLEADLKRILASWFDIGFLELRSIAWNSPASLLEKLIAYEAVHAIRSWADLKNRLDSDRRCFAFFHPRMPDEPLIFVEIALVNGMAGNVQSLLDEEKPADDPQRADTAIFYSISNAQRGLAGISFGNFLIKRVVDVLTHELPNLKTFATLSPIPGFRAWLDEAVAKDGDALLSETERSALRVTLPAGNDGPLLARALALKGWQENAALADALQTPLMRLSARYLSQAKRKGGNTALDSVAHFHLSNGARMERLNWLGDTSPKGISQAAGMMINYLYKLDQIDANHEAYTGDGKIAMSNSFRALVKG